MFIETPSSRFLPHKNYELIFPPTYEDFTKRVDYLHMSGKFWSARVSDVIVGYSGKLFIGCGDYGKNAGPCPLYSYDIATKNWQLEATLPTEQIKIIKEIDGNLYIPCLDNSGDDSVTRLFRRTSGESWETISIAYPSSHTFALEKIEGKILLDIAQVPESNAAAVAVSEDGGETWSKVQCYEADGVTLPSPGNGFLNRLQSGFFYLNGTLYAIDTLFGFSMWVVMYQYDSSLNKFIRVTKYFTPPGVNPEDRFNKSLANRKVLVSQYSALPGATSVLPSILVLGNKFLTLQFVHMARWETSSNKPGGASKYVLTWDYYHSKRYTMFVPDGEEYMYDYLPPTGNFQEGSRSAYVDVDDIRYTSDRDVIDTSVSGDMLYILQVERNNFYLDRISSGEHIGELNKPITISIYSTSDLENYTQEFSSNFPVWPTCFTVIDGFAYICMGGDIHLESSWVGAIVKAKLNS